MSKQYETTLFWQKATKSSQVYGNAVLTAMYIPNNVIDQLTSSEVEGVVPSTIIITITTKEN